MPNGHHLALIGLPGAGKSTVARAVAAAIHRPLVDFDTEIERREGRPIADIFADSGEAHFRTLEAQLTRELVSSPSAVLDPGGGWVTQEKTVALIRPRTKLVWLRVSPGAALRRMGGNRSDRPLLMKGDPEGVLTRLAADRETSYSRADAAIDTELLTLQELVQQIAQLASLWGVPIG
ncbi:MAG: shikimate kinase [Gemmatimonadaceae bacterium]